APRDVRRGIHPAAQGLRAARAHGEAGGRRTRDRLPRGPARRLHDRAGVERGRRSRHALSKLGGGLTPPFRTSPLSVAPAKPALGAEPPLARGLRAKSTRVAAPTPRTCRPRRG